jgi:ATP-dependent protease ClpP protease subunit
VSRFEPGRVHGREAKEYGLIDEIITSRKPH